MIIGTGIDIVELDRIKKIMKRQPRFIDRILTMNEQDAWQQLRSEQRKIEMLAGRFAAKEAFAKAYGTGIGRIRFQDIEVTSQPSGAPKLTCTYAADLNVFVSISHSEQYAVAQVIIEQPNYGSSA